MSSGLADAGDSAADAPWAARPWSRSLLRLAVSCAPCSRSTSRDSPSPTATTKSACTCTRTVRTAPAGVWRLWHPVGRLLPARHLGAAWAAYPCVSGSRGSL